MILSILKFILAIGILAFFHELGHYLVARFNKIDVEEFGIGFPFPGIPALKLFSFKGTVFSLNWIPFGAFVRIKGETDPSIPGGFYHAKPGARIAVMLGGPLVNIILGILMFSLVFVRTGAPDTTKVQLDLVNSSSPAAEAGLLAGDIITAVNREKINSMAELSSIVNDNLGKELEIEVLRNNEELTFFVVPRVNPPEGEGAMGIVMTNPVVQISWLQALPYGTRMAYEQTRELFLLPGRLIAGEIDTEQARILGPKGMYDIYSQVQEMDEEASSDASSETPAVNTLWLFATISVAFGLTNLFPLPALDGGRILFVLPELIFKKRVPPQYENLIHLIGFVALIAFMVYVTTQDFINPIVLP